MMYLEMAKYSLILLVMFLLAGAVLYALIKRFGLPGVVKGVLGGMGAVGKGLLVFFAAGASADEEDDTKHESLVGEVVHDADYHGVASGYTDENGDIYI